MRILLSVACCGLLTAPLLFPRAGGEGEPPSVTIDGPREGPINEDPPDVCDTGCSAASSAIDELSVEEYLALIEAWAADPDREGGRALETLLFHGAQVPGLAAFHGTGSLRGSDVAYLLREVARDHALLSVRLVNEAGEERLRLGPARVPLGEKQHLFPEHLSDLQPPEVSGTVRRVGVDHLWARL